MTEIAQNIFDKGLQQDISKLRTPHGYTTDSYQIEITNREGSNFAATTANGNEVEFTLTAGFQPMAAREFDGVLYIASINPSTKYLEVGSYQAPPVRDGANPSPSGPGVAEYRALQNGYYADENQYFPFSYPYQFFDIDTATDPEFIDMVLQLDYDNTINVILTSKSFQPLMINTNFSYNSKDNTYTYERDAYPTEDLITLTRLLLDSADTLTVDYLNIDSGGSLKPGTYVYYFSYLTADFNETEIVGKSKFCQVWFGEGDQIQGGDATELTTKRVQLTLGGLDTTYTYIQPYFTYVGGDEVRTKQIVKFGQPITITGQNMIFTHTGTEEVDDIPVDELGQDFANIASAGSAAAVKGYLFFGDITERERVDEDLKAFAETVELEETDITYAAGDDLYGDPQKVYENLGYFRGESYAFGLVARYKGGGYSPVFPVKGWDYQLGVATQDGAGNETGVIRLESAETSSIHTVGAAITVKGIRAKFTTVASTTITDKISEFFLVRADRQNTRLIGQGASMPTRLAPPSPYIENDGSYYNEKGNDPDAYKYFPLLDGIIEGHCVHEGNQPLNCLVDEVNNLRTPFHLFAIKDLVGESDVLSSVALDRQAFYSVEAMGNRPEFNTRASTAGFLQALGDIQFRVKDRVDRNGGGADTFISSAGGFTNYNPTSLPNAQIGTFYDFEAFIADPVNITVDRSSLVGEGTFATGNDFISRLQTVLYHGWSSAGRFVGHRVAMSAFPYVGLELQADLGSKSSNRPGGTDARIFNLDSTNSTDFYNSIAEDVDLHVYSNYNTNAAAAHLVNLYSDDPFALSAVEYYPNRDSIPFTQVGARIPLPIGVAIDDQIIFEGDCYINKVYQRMHYSGFRDALEIDEPDRKNIPMGHLFSFYAESTFNTRARQNHFINANDLEEATFYPYNTNYRNLRYPDSQVIGAGYRYEHPDVSYFPNPILLPDSRSSFYSRVFASGRHIPNSFENGYRQFTTQFQDFPSQYGKIIRLVAYGADLVIVYEHGIGVTPIEPRVPTGQDIAGEVFIKSEGVITSAFGPIATRYGSQDPLAVYQSPHFIYGIDRQERKIWRIGGRNNFEILSDGFISSKIQSITNPVVGYDPQAKLVYFRADEFCYIYSEELGIFTTTSSNGGTFYTELAGQGMLGFQNNSAYLYKPGLNTLYGNTFEPYIEFAVNDNIALTKVFDYVNIISNNVAPREIRLTALNADGSINQESVITQGVDFYTEQDRIFYRDKRWVAQVPRSPNNTYTELEGWGDDNRLRDKYILVRLTYDSIEFETMAVQTFYRISRS